jgi:hypothetical protein
MRFKDTFRANKEIIEWGDWKHVKMPPAAFPLSYGPKRSYRLGSAYRWRIIRFGALDHKFRVLVAYRDDIEEYISILGMEVGNDTRIIAEVCFHGSHPGWHVHADCADVRNTPIGAQRWPGMNRRPKGRSRHRRTAYVVGYSKMNDAHALEIAVKRFNLHQNADDLFGRKQGGMES